MNLPMLVLLCTSSLFSASAHAQWQWVDEQGRKVFSDRPPPSQVPADRIHKRPAGANGKTTTQPSTPPPPALPSSQTAGRSPGIDKDLEAKKTADEAEQAQREKAQAQEQEKKLARARQDNCARAQTAQTALADGRLMAHTNAQGERVFMDDATRSAERQRAQAAIASDCGPADNHGASTSRSP